MAHDLPLNPDLGGEDEAMAPRLSVLHSPAPGVTVITSQGHTETVAVSYRNEKH